MFVREARIPVPPILERSFDNLYLLGDAGHSLQQLMSVILRYDDMIEKLARDVEQQVARHVTVLRECFQDPLNRIGVLLPEARQKLALIRDEAARLPGA